jgi:hypothetical protein
LRPPGSTSPGQNIEALKKGIAEMKKKGWSYLGGRRWADISREERFFCAHLYALAHESPERLVRAINEANADKAVIGWQPLLETVDWEVGFEVCLFRDLRHHKLLQRNIENASLKRTFDLCLFSANRIILIEAKAQQGFESDGEQLSGFKADLENARAALVDVAAALPDLRLDLLLIASSPAVKKLHAMLPGIHYSLTWAALYDTYKDEVLVRAEGIYGDVGGSNSDRRMKGQELWLAHKQQVASCPKFVGRGGGIDALQADLPGEWRTRLYEVSNATDKPDNRNWFPFAKFIEAVQPYISA